MARQVSKNPKSISEFSAKLDQSSDENQVFQSIANSLDTFIMAERISVAILVPHEPFAEVTALNSHTTNLPVSHRVHIEGSAIGEAIQTQKVVQWGIDSEEKFTEAKHLFHIGYKHFLVAPLIQSGKVLGTINLGRKDYSFTSQESRLLQDLAVVAAVAISRVRVLDQTKAELNQQKKSTQKLTLISEVAARLSGCIEAKSAFDIIVDALVLIFDVSRVSYAEMRGPDSAGIRWVSSNSSRVLGESFPLRGTGLELAFRTGDVAHFPDLKSSNYPEHLSLVSAGITSGSCYPIKDGNTTISCLNIGSRDPSICDPENETLVFTLVSIFNSTLHRLRAQEQALRTQRAQQARFQAISQATSLGLFLADPTGQQTYANQALEELSSDGNWYNSALTSQRQELRKLWEDYTSDPGPRLETEFQSSPETYLRLVASVVKDGPTLLGYIGIITDVTQKKRQDKANWHSQKMESLGVLAGGLAHDFNNILAAALGNLELVRDSLEVEHVALEELDLASQSMQQAAQLTRQMLAYSGKAPLRIQKTNLSELIHEISNLVASTLPKNVQLRKELVQRTAPISGDPTQLKQVILNLLTNAAESMPKDGGTIVLSLESVNIIEGQSDWSAPPGRYVQLSCRDSGIGMKPETMERIFDPFFSTKHTGSGLGLSATMGIVRSHNGDLSVESTPSEGTLFRIIFPENAQRVVNNQAGGPLAYLADDDPQVRAVVRKMLNRLGYSVIEASDGQELLDSIERETETIRLVFSDISMPYLDGLAVASHLAEHHPNLPVILMSGYVNRKDEVELGKRSFFLEKPFTANALREVVQLATQSQNGC